LFQSAGIRPARISAFSPSLLRSHGHLRVKG
jgi:hypothetical protein